ncbi:MAG: isochorismatase family protein [Acidimicrobiia bacterium]|nr:isochorismatase family protein [Acidimicrobiia bacterium]
MATIFTRIIQGEIPSHRVHEDEHTCAFLDINPARPGHTLVVPRQEAPTVFDLDPAAYDALWRAVRRVAGRLQRATACERVVVVVYGADVPHAHVHLIPLEAGGHLAFPEPQSAVPEELAAMAERIRAADRPAYDERSALVVVDVQHDFADPSGSLYVKRAEEILVPINAEIARATAAGATVVYTQDWHPAATPHFARDGGVWPVHCVGGTPGAEFHPALHIADGALFTRKGTGGEDGYSAFSVRHPVGGEVSSTGLDEALREQGVDRVVLVGLATDYCVKETGLDAVRLGFEAAVVTAAVRAVDLQPGDGERALRDLAEHGVEMR